MLKKTLIISYEKYLLQNWKGHLMNFPIPKTSDIDFFFIDNYLNYTIQLAKQYRDYSIVFYAIKTINKKELSDNTRYLYAKKMLSLLLLYPSLSPFFKPYILDSFHNKEKPIRLLEDFLPVIFERALQENITTTISFCLYFAIYYGINIQKVQQWIQKIIQINDCVSLLLAWKYCKNMNLKKELSIINKKTKEILNGIRREQEHFWLFLYETLEQEHFIHHRTFLSDLKENNISFMISENEIAYKVKPNLLRIVLPVYSS